MVLLFTLLATVAHDRLPTLLVDHHYTTCMHVVVFCLWSLSLSALGTLCWQRPHSKLDLWLIVVMAIWVFDIALSALLNAQRFDLGFYVGRMYGLLASSFVLLVLLYESSVVYARVLAMHQRGQQRSDELAYLNKELESFSYSVSHDLRAPLRAIDGFSAILARDHSSQLDAVGQRMLHIVRNNVGRMSNLIDDMLTFSKLGRTPLRTRPVDLTALARELIDEQQVRAVGRVLDIRLAELGLVEADPALLRQALGNLIDNAVKYSSKQATAVIEIAPAGAVAAGMRTFFIKDNGAGFDMRYADKLFGVFQRLHSSDEFEGTGVGLAIVQRVIVRHGGQIWAEAAPGQGACFWWSLSIGTE